MAVVDGRAKISATAVLVLNEDEIGALDALFGYDINVFLKTFYELMGKAYLQPYEKGLRSLSQSCREQLPGILRRANEAREVFEGQKVARYPERKKPEEPVLCTRAEGHMGPCNGIRNEGCPRTEEERKA